MLMTYTSLAHLPVPHSTVLQFPLQETNERLERDLREIRSMAASGGMLSVLNIVSFMLRSLKAG